MQKMIPDLLAKSLFAITFVSIYPLVSPHISEEWFIYIAQINCFLYDPSEVAGSQRHTTYLAELWCIHPGKFEVICHRHAIIKISKLQCF